ncbi:hypothetical protein GCK32_013629 [Trichostrongylus colubriformis]|uniref:Uncharacterized protein n=1 Tax=Trichostrongylus colubriformis TaxID=6319 RepID=A0AAN8FS46_TRICO
MSRFLQNGSIARQKQFNSTWDWERIRENYYKKPSLLFDKEGVTPKTAYLGDVARPNGGSKGP